MVSFFKVPFLSGIHFAFATPTVWCLVGRELRVAFRYLLDQVQFHLVTKRLINEPSQAAKKNKQTKKCNTGRNRPQKAPFLVRCVVFQFDICYVEFQFKLWILRMQSSRRGWAKFIERPLNSAWFGQTVFNEITLYILMFNFCKSSPNWNKLKCAKKIMPRYT